MIGQHQDLCLSVAHALKSWSVGCRRLRQAGRLQPLMAYLRDTEAHGNDSAGADFSVLGAKGKT